MAHQNVDQVKKILRFENIIFKDRKFCCEKDCILEKIHRLSYPKSNTKFERIGKLIRSFRSNARKFEELDISWWKMMKDDTGEAYILSKINHDV